MADEPNHPPALARHWPKRALVTGLVAASAGLLYVAAVGITAGWNLARPGSRDLNDRQRQDRDNPSRIGLRVTAAAAPDGTPYLYCTPDPIAGPGARGIALRAQLTAEGHSMPTYGFTSATVILLHGRHGSKDGLLGIAERFAAAGFRVLIPDLPGHGSHPVRACGYGAGPGEAGIPAAVFDDASWRFGIPPDQPAILCGMSMGGSFAIHAASLLPRRWDRMIIISSFANLGEIVHGSLVRWTGPAAPLARTITRKTVITLGGHAPDLVQPERLAPDIKIPVLVIHGSDDDLIPAAHGRRIHHAAGGRNKTWIEVAGANHWNVLITPQPVYAPMILWAGSRGSF